MDGLILPHVDGYVHNFFFYSLGFEEGVFTGEVVVNGSVVDVVFTCDEGAVHEGVEGVFPCGEMGEVLLAVGFFLGKEHTHLPRKHWHPEEGCGAHVFGFAVDDFVSLFHRCQPQARSI